MNKRKKYAGILAAALVAGAIGTGAASAAGGDDHSNRGSSNSPANQEATHARSHKHTGKHKGRDKAAENQAKRDDDASDKSISDPTALEKASAAALKYTGGGRVTETEQGDEESFYEVEVTRDDGSVVDVQLDRNFNVVGSEGDDDGAKDEE